MKRGAPFFAEIQDGPIDEDQLALAQELVRRKAASFAPERFVDHYEAALRELIKAKAEGQDLSIDEPSTEGGVVIDLMQALKQSLNDKAERGEPSKRKRATAEVHELARPREIKAAASKTKKPSPPTKAVKNRAEPQPRRRKAS